MIEAVMKRYYGGHIQGLDLKLIISDCEFYLINKVFSKYNQANGKAYSYLGTCIKHYFYDRFIVKSRGTPRFLDVDQKDQHGDPILQIADQSNADSTDIDSLRLAAKRKLVGVTRKSNKVIINTILEAVQDEDFEMNKYALTYLLLKATGLRIQQLKIIMHRVDLVQCILTTREVDFYESLIRQYLSKNKRHKNYITSAINERSVKKAIKEIREGKQNVVEAIPEDMG